MKPKGSRSKGGEVAKPQQTRAKTSSSTQAKGHWVSKEDLAQLQDRLREAQETLDAIRSGEVDAVVVNGAHGSQIYSLTSAEQPYRVYVERMQEGAVTVSAEGLVLYSNQRFADMVKSPLERVISSEARSHLPEAAWQTLAAVLTDSDDFAKYECLMHCSDGSTLPVHLTASRLPLQDEVVMCLVVTDLTVQKGHEELRLAKEVAERASRAKDSFLATLSHELRTPLTPALMSLITLEQDESLPEHVLTDLSMIRRNIELEARLIDDLLDVTRIAHGKLELHTAPVDLHVVLHRALETCRASLDAKHQHLELTLNAEHTRTEGDAIRLQQVLWNLIRNAVKFTARNGTISITTSNPGAKRFQLEVSDDGIGFEPQNASKLFQAFEQSGREITRQFGGLGLGLTISRSIVEAHQGEIHAHSEGLNQGATFTSSSSR